MKKEMNNCKNCQWWDSDWTWKDGSAECLKEGRNREGSPARFEIDWSVSDDSGLQVRLVTGAEFGCVLFEEKQSKEEGEDE